MTSEELVKATIQFAKPERVAWFLPEKWGSDLAFATMDPHADARPVYAGEQVDEWGSVWDNIGVCRLGEVKHPVLAEWKNYDKMTIPDVLAPYRWKNAEALVVEHHRQNKYIIAYGMSIYERIHFLRGLENTWEDIYLEPERLKDLIQLLVDMNLKLIGKLKELGIHGLMFCDDWGLQDKLMISPDKWYEFWFPAYQKIYQSAHQAGISTWLHSCGNIVEILDGLIEAGLDVIQMDQQQNMGLELLGNRFAGRITFWCPVDIQNMMCKGTPAEIRAYIHKMFDCLATENGGFIAGWYADPVGAGHSQENIDAMCDEFVKLRY